MADEGMARMVMTRYKALVNRVLEPCAVSLARAGVSPTVLTLLGPFLSALICMTFVRTRAVLPFCIAITAVSCLDGLDGAVARVSGRVTKFGAYLDAVCDRYVEAMTVLAVAFVTGYWVLSMAVLTGSLLVSYTKARAAMEVPISNQEWPDLMERTERALLFLIGLTASQLVPWKPWGRDLFWWTLVLLLVLSHGTVIQRMWRARRFILERSSQ